MPRLVGDGDHVKALDIPETQALIAMTDTAESYWMHILMGRVRDAIWITIDPHLKLVVEDLGAEEIVPIQRNAELPLAGGPFLHFDELTSAHLATLRAAAHGLAAVHGVSLRLPMNTAAGGASVEWRFADTSCSQFAQEVPPADLAHQIPKDVRIQGAHAIIPLQNEATGAVDFTFAQLVDTAKIDEWVASKREGCGRDPRLSGLGHRGALTQPLFREAVNDWLQASAALALPTTTPLPALTTAMTTPGQAFLPSSSSYLAPQVEVNPTIFEGSPACVELECAIAKSGSDVMSYFQNLVTSSGVDARSSVVHGLRYECFSIYLIGCVDRLNGFTLAAYEHISRRILQAVRAIQTNPRAPDFGGLDAYMRHADDALGSLQTPAFDKHVTEHQKGQAQYWKQSRSHREETDAEQTRNRNKNKKNGNKKDGE